MMNRPERINISGFTIVEMMIVVMIISILAAISIPNYLLHTRRARASEAVATMSMIRQSLRDYYIVNGSYYDVASGDLAADASDSPPGVSVDVGIAQYFSNAAFSVDGTSPTSARFTSPAAQGFLITADGSASVACGSSNCALHNTSVTDFRLEMDNTGRTFVSFNAGTNWSEY